MDRFGKEEEKALLRVIRSADKTLSYYSFSYLGEGGEVYKFEREFARWLGRKYCVSVNSGTSALFCAIMAGRGKARRGSARRGMAWRGMKWDGEISIPAYTFVSDASMVLANGLTPDFRDIDELDYCVQDLNDSNFAIPVHTLGNVCEPSRFKDCDYVIEDCAQCVGGKWNGKKAGTFGDISIFSCQGTKNLTTGEGGLICMDDKELYERCCAIRNHGDYYRNTNFVGYNFRMTELQAAVGRCQLTKVNKFLLSFKKSAELIFDLLPDGIDAPYIPKEVEHAYFILGCVYHGKNKELFLNKLHSKRAKAGLLWSKKESDIPGGNAPPGNIISGGYKKPLYEIPLYQRYKRNCPNTVDVIKKAVWIDIHRFTDSEKIKREMELVRKTYAEIN